MAPRDEIELIGQARAGDQAAQDRLYREYFAGSRAIGSLLAREVPEPADREDVLHDAFLSLLRSGAEFRGESRLGTFVYRVVQIAVLQKRRSDRARREHQMVRLTYDFQGEERERELAVDDYQYEEVDADATARKLYALVPEPLRTALRLRVSEELSYDEIAARTNAPINTVSTRIFKARSLLARLLNGDRPAGKKLERLIGVISDGSADSQTASLHTSRLMGSFLSCGPWSTNPASMPRPTNSFRASANPSANSRAEPA